MKFSCEKALLQQAISVASRTVAVKSSIPALEGILLEADDKGLRLTGYDLETGIRALVEAEVAEGGSLVLSAKLLGDIVRSMPDEVIYFESKGMNVSISCGRAKFSLMGSDSEDYPDLPSVDEYVNSVTMQQRVLRSVIAQTRFAISANQTRPIHTGALFEVEGDKSLTVVAVDGFRLALRRETAEDKTGIDSFSFVVPGRALSEIEKLCADSEEGATLIQGGRHIMFRIGSITLICRRLEGEFLNYRQAVPRNNPIVLTAARTALIHTVERVSLMISEKQRSPLRCTFGENILNISATSSYGNADDECAIAGDGKELNIGFNNHYLLDALRAAPADEVRLELNTPISPCIILPADGTDSFLYMVLPVRLKQ